MEVTGPGIPPLTPHLFRNHLFFAPSHWSSSGVKEFPLRGMDMGEDRPSTQRQDPTIGAGDVQIQPMTVAVTNL